MGVPHPGCQGRTAPSGGSELKMRVVRIGSRENGRFKLIRTLGSSARARKREGMILLEGEKLVFDWCRHRGRPRTLVLSETAFSAGAAVDALELLVLPDRLFRWVSGVKTPTGVMAIVPMPPSGEGPAGDSALMLEGVQDPGNLGSLLRSAASASVGTVFLSPGCADLWSPKVLRAGMGGHFALDIRWGSDLSGALSGFHGRVLAADSSAGTDLFECDLRGPLAFLLGSEGRGLPPRLLERADEVVRIPMAPGCDSLNVAAAGAVCLFERRRQEGETKRVKKP